MSRRVKITEFISFCIEAYARSKRMSGAEVAALFARTGAIAYLRNGYDVLHTMGDAWIVSDMEEFLRMRGVAA